MRVERIWGRTARRTSAEEVEGTPPRRPCAGLLAVLLLAICPPLLNPAPVSAQALKMDRLSVEPRVGVAFPTGDFGNVDPACPSGGSACPFPLQTGTATGWRWAISTHYALSPRWSVVGEFGKAHLGCSAIFCGTTEKPEIQGLSLGVRAIAFPLGSMDIWVEGAGVLEQATIIRSQDQEGNRNPSAVTYPWSLGFSGGVGAELPLRGAYDFFFTPGFRFRYVPADPPTSDSDLASITATYFLFEVGFRAALGR